MSPVKISPPPVATDDIGVLCCDPKAFTHTNPLEGLKRGGSLVWESEESPETAWQRIPVEHRQFVIDNNIRVFILPGFDIARKATNQTELQLRMQGNAFLGAFFRVSPFLNRFHITEEQFHRQFNTNVLGLLLTTQEALRLFGPEGVSQPAMTQLVTRLEKEGLAVRGNDPADGRVVVVSITDAGRAALMRRRDGRAEALAVLLARLEPAEHAALVAALPALDRLGDLMTDQP